MSDQSLRFCATWNDAKEQGKGVRGAILIDLQKELQRFIEKDGVEVKADPKDPLSLVILVPEGLLQFEVDKDQIPEPGVKFLQTFMPTLAKATLKFKDDINAIIVEGHTDTRGTDEHNLPLSQRRSMAVVMESLKALGGESRNRFLDLLSATGRGSVEPYTVNGAVDMDKSRRVVFKIRIRSFEQRGKQILVTMTDEKKS
ncbi:MAG: OmpA family protein [Deltaproteobacteria bacterium]|nr:OmpA family protein [Deltaproteobacteria bacterium]